MPIPNLAGMVGETEGKDVFGKDKNHLIGYISVWRILYHIYLFCWLQTLSQYVA